MRADHRMFLYVCKLTMSSNDMDDVEKSKLGAPPGYPGENDSITSIHQSHTMMTVLFVIEKVRSYQSEVIV